MVGTGSPSLRMVIQFFQSRYGGGSSRLHSGSRLVPGAGQTKLELRLRGGEYVVCGGTCGTGEFSNLGLI